MTKDHAPPSSRRHRRGDESPAPVVPPTYPDTGTKQIEPADFAAMQARLDAFIERRFAPMIPALGEAFFQPARRGELDDPGLREAFRSWSLLGYRDPQGLRLIDMFAAAGLHAEPHIDRALNAMRQARFRVLRISSRNEHQKLLATFDLLDDAEVSLLDRLAYDQVAVDEMLCGWFFPAAGIWRALGAVTRVAKVSGDELRAAISSLAAHEQMSPAELGERRSMKLFWMLYRATALAPSV